MLLSEDYHGLREVLMLNAELCGLNDVYRELADTIGIEKTLIVYNMFKGTQVSFPRQLFSKEYIHGAIIREFNGSNIPHLAQKYSYSERSIRRILKEKHKQEV